MVTASSCPQRNVAVARLLRRSRLGHAAAAVERTRCAPRVVNYHGTPRRLEDAFADQIDYLLERYRPLSPDALLSWPPRREPGAPQLLFTFDDGLRNHYEVAAPLLEKRGLRGVFAIPTAFLSVTIEEQPSWFRKHVRSSPTTEHTADDDLLALTWEQTRDLAARGHAICCHTRTHRFLDDSVDSETIRTEVEGARVELEDRIGMAVPGFCWPVSRPRHSRVADDAVRGAFRYALVGGHGSRNRDPYLVGRTNIEASWPLEVVDLQTSGIAGTATRLRALTVSR